MDISADQEKLKDDDVAYLLGKRVVGLLLPILVTMLFVSWSVLNLSGLYAGQHQSPLFVVMNEDNQKSVGEKIGSSVLNAFIFVGCITLITFLIVILYKCHCKFILFAWMLLSVTFVLFAMLWVWLDLICTRFQIPYDIITVVFLLWNVVVVGVISIFYYSHLVLAQVYFVVSSIVMAWLLTFIPEWTTWSLLVCISIYDVLAVLCPYGPLRLLINTSISRNEPIPALVYSTSDEAELARAKKNRRELEEEEEMCTNDDAHAGKKNNSNAQRSAKISPASRFYNSLMGLPFKLGLGDIVFFSLLTGKTIPYAFMPWVMSIVAVLIGLIGTLVNLLLFKSENRALPALPISVFCGVVVVFLSYFLIIPLDWFATTSMLAL
ncbi:presenilin-like aspartic peptidase [Trypanosoma theileri]|uniref:Presenilin n=1 Tax=Trypanosoma theileri TaxID=67003 RepID=A0A1X0NVS4_9TRYP|nr:presenilin-like aspartic peptidase [Trypanosoma theileri]ORC88220.1 presenilin-like aspartic peptidase [Trypanosoma theileri]